MELPNQILQGFVLELGHHSEDSFRQNNVHAVMFTRAIIMPVVRQQERTVKARKAFEDRLYGTQDIQIDVATGWDAGTSAHQFQIEGENLRSRCVVSGVEGRDRVRFSDDGEAMIASREDSLDGVLARVVRDDRCTAGRYPGTQNYLRCGRIRRFSTA